MIELQPSRHVTTTWLAFLTIVCLFGLSATAQAAPNIIFVMVDDMGYGDLGSYGGKEIATPRLDRMAAEGLRFTQCYTGSAVCAPSRSVLMTGQHTGHTTVRGNFGKEGGVVGLGGGKGRVPLRAEDVTVAEILKKTGYTTGLTGKWGLGEPNTTGHPNRQGFDEFFGYLNQRRAHTYYPTFIWRNEEKVELKGNQDGQRGEYTHDMFTDFVLRFIRDQQKGPFFLYLAWTVPHAKFEIPSVEPYADRPWSDQEKVYAAMLARVDRDMGRIFYAPQGARHRPRDRRLFLQ
jgi:arylsulfatase A-like enzyme